MRSGEVSQRQERWGQRSATGHIKYENKEKLSWGKRSKRGGEGRGANPNNVENNNAYT